MRLRRSQPQLEAGRKGLQQRTAQLAGGQFRAPVTQAPHGPIGDTTGHDRAETGQIAVHIQSQSVLTDPTPGTDADGRQLVPVQPHPGETVDPLTCQPQPGEQVDHHLLEGAQVAVQVSAVALQVEHGVEHQLAGGVVGHLAAPVDPQQRQRRGSGVKAQMVLTAPSSQGVTGLVFEQEQRIRPLQIAQQPLLQLLLRLPAQRERQGPPRLEQDRFKKDCVELGGHRGAYLALGVESTGGGCHLMKLLIHGRNLEVTPAIRDYTETKLTRAINHFEGMVKEADVHLSVARNPRVPQQVAEVTMFANGTVIRAQERSDNLYASIDMVASKLSRQLNRYKERLQDRQQGPVHRSARDEEAGAASLPPPGATLTDGREPELPSRGVRRKYFDMAPMSLDEAVHQLELIDHDFFVFRDSDSGQIQVVYHRNHGGFGVIQPKDA